MQYDTFTYAVFAAFGLIFGSFANVLIYRLPLGKSLMWPNSFCPNCKVPIKPHENIPVLSFILLMGRCSNCKKPISVRYPLIEILMATLWLLPLMAGFAFPKAIIMGLLTTLLVAVFFIDIEHMIIPDQIVISIIALSIPAFFLDDTVVWYDRLLGFAAGGGLLLLLAFFSEKVFKKEGMGGGDIKLMAAAGLMLGWAQILVSLFVGAVFSLLGIILIITPLKKRFPSGEQIPFGPALAAGILFMCYFGDYITDWLGRNIFGVVT